MPYRFSRRSFIAGTGAAVGLHALLRSAEALAQGSAARPKRLLVTHHPCGTMRYAWTPTGGGTTYTTSRLLQPFEDAGLRDDMIILDGLNMAVIGGPGGGAEKGTVMMMTGTPTKGTRSGESETDDAMAAGPSFDQLLLSLRPEMARVVPSLYGLCDERVDFQEISTRCLSYSMATRPQMAAIWNAPGGEAPNENVPLRATLKPFDMYAQAFGTLMPGGSTGGNLDALAKARLAKKSILDLSLRELARLRTLAPSSQKALLDAHEGAIRALEMKLDAMGSSSAACMVPAPPPADLVAPIDDGKNHNNYGGLSSAVAATADDPLHAVLGEAFQAILRTAFQCDITRVGLFQWSPGTNHVAFAGLYPGPPPLILQHHPAVHGIISQAQMVPTNPVAEFAVAVELWYNVRMASFLKMLKETPDLHDPNGGNLLDNTVVPYLTEVADPTSVMSPMPLTLFGGKNLGFVGGQYLDFANRSYVDLLLTILQSFGVTLADLQAATVNGQAGATLLKARFSGPLPGVLG